jgi:FkbM family methyltransferase
MSSKQNTSKLSRRNLTIVGCGLLGLVLITVVYFGTKKKHSVWMDHDPSFLQYANLTTFDYDIMEFKLDEENEFFVDAMLYSPEGSKFLDVGAFIGNTCIPVAKKLKELGREDVQVIAFEPNPEYCSHINAHGKELGLNLKCEPYVISDHDGEIYRKSNEKSGTMYDEHFKEEGGQVMESKKLDDFNLGHVEFAKFDVEGHEPMALRGAHETLLHTNTLYVEMWNDVHYKERMEGALQEGSHNKRILDELPFCVPKRKIEKNILFKCACKGCK